jgi:hypothetical protein
VQAVLVRCRQYKYGAGSTSTVQAVLVRCRQYKYGAGSTSTVQAGSTVQKQAITPPPSGGMSPTVCTPTLAQNPERLLLLNPAPGIGRKGVYLYNLPEVSSAVRCLGVPGVSARFGTDPFIWNWAMWLIARAVPRSFLQDRSQVGVPMAHMVAGMLCIKHMVLRRLALECGGDGGGGGGGG